MMPADAAALIIPYPFTTSPYKAHWIFFAHLGCVDLTMIRVVVIPESVFMIYFELT